MKKMLFIMNPFAGQKRANRQLSDLLLMFTKAGYDVITHMTTGTGSAAEAAERLAGEVELIVCCGGDGTFNETVSGLLNSGAHVKLGYTPAGPTNDFAASLKLPTHIPQAARGILEGEAAPYDVGKFGDR